MNNETIDITGWQSLKVEEGDVVLIKMPEMTPDQQHNVHDALVRLQKQTGIKFIGIPHGYEPVALKKHPLY